MVCVTVRTRRTWTACLESRQNRGSRGRSALIPVSRFLAAFPVLRPPSVEVQVGHKTCRSCWPSSTESRPSSRTFLAEVARSSHKSLTDFQRGLNLSLLRGLLFASAHALHQWLSFFFCLLFFFVVLIYHSNTFPHPAQRGKQKAAN